MTGCVRDYRGNAKGEVGHPPGPLTLREGGRFLAKLRNDMRVLGMTGRVRDYRGDAKGKLGIPLAPLR